MYMCMYNLNVYINVLSEYDKCIYSFIFYFQQIQDN